MIAKEIEEKYEIVVGLEIHAQLATKSKIFSSSPTTFGASPNAQASIIDLGYPGTLPVLNEQAVLMAVKFALAINAHINQKNVFARKNYFYPDLPKGYQISQFHHPIVGKGLVEFELNSEVKNAIILIGVKANGKISSTNQAFNFYY